MNEKKEKSIIALPYDDKKRAAEAGRKASRLEELAHNFLCAALQGNSETAPDVLRAMAWREANAFVNDAEELRDKLVEGEE